MTLSPFHLHCVISRSASWVKLQWILAGHHASCGVFLLMVCTHPIAAVENRDVFLIKMHQHFRLVYFVYTWPCIIIMNVNMQRSEFKNLGILIGMSIVQGGYGFPALHPAVYKYMVTGTYLNLNVPSTDVPDAGVCALIDQVCEIETMDHGKLKWSIILYRS